MLGVLVLSLRPGQQQVTQGSAPPYARAPAPAGPAWACLVPKRLRRQLPRQAAVLHELQATHRRFERAAGGGGEAEGGLCDLDACLQARPLYS